LAGVFYIMIAFFVGLAAINSHTNMLYWLFSLMLSTVVVSGFYSGMMLMGLSARRIVPRRGMVGQSLTAEYELANRNRIIACFALNVDDHVLDGDDAPRGTFRRGMRGGRVASGWALHIPPRGSARVRSTVVPRRRGLLELRGFEVHSGFPFGLVRKALVFKRSAQVIVHPRCHRLGRRLIAELFGGDSSSPNTSRDLGGQEDFYGLREHRPGDNVRMIHWRRSARDGTLMTRQMTRPRPAQIVILLDLRPGEHTPDQAERAIELAASWIAHADAEGYAVGLAVAGPVAPVLRPGAGRDQRNRLLDALALIDLRDADHGTPPLNERAGHLVISPLPRQDPIGPPDAARLTAADLNRHAPPHAAKESAA
jgi:uncharacterized protein (DUF58 family)